ncbi:hypothetical protein [Streptomyces sp. NPDC088789]|uniref:hypothetical protein n=1 Tax=Streptomyces sp. NPDC088789 TaxID=3365899 RepID=UPI003818BEE9
MSASFQTPETPPPAPGGSDAPSSPVAAAAAVIDATMDRHTAATATQLAEAEHTAGLLFDPERVQAIARSAIEQARAEYEAKLDDLRDREVGAYFKLRYDRLQRLLLGHPDTDLMSVAEILATVDGRDTRAGAPLALDWGGLVMGPSGDTDDENTLVPCTTTLGAPAALVLTDSHRAELARLLALTGPCAVGECGTLTDYDASDPALWGWIRVEVAGLEGGPRWYCSPPCVAAALTRAAAELAADDQAAAVDVDVRYGPGASDAYALQVAEAAGVEAERGDGGGSW